MKRPAFLHDPSPLQFLRLAVVKAELGESAATTYRAIAAGMLPRPIELGPNRKGWPRYEVDAINRARLAGKSIDEQRAIAASLQSSRKRLASATTSEIHAFVRELLEHRGSDEKPSRRGKVSL